MLGQRRRRCLSIDSTSDSCLVFARSLPASESQQHKIHSHGHAVYSGNWFLQATEMFLKAPRGIKIEKLFCIK